MPHEPRIRPISDVARDLGLAPEHLVPYGDDKAKVRLAARLASPRPPGRLVLVSAITPTAAGEGKTTVEARVGDVSGAADVLVVFRTIETLEASPVNIPLKVGELGRVTLVARDPQGAQIPEVAATWTSSDPLVATCSGGTVLGIGPGSTTIRVVCGAKSAEVSVIVF